MQASVSDHDQRDVVNAFKLLLNYNNFPKSYSFLFTVVIIIFIHFQTLSGFLKEKNEIYILAGLISKWKCLFSVTVFVFLNFSESDSDREV